MSKTKTGAKLLRPRDIPDEYGITERQVRRWISERRIAVVKPAGVTGPAYIERAVLDAFIEAHTVPASR